MEGTFEMLSVRLMAVGPELIKAYVGMVREGFPDLRFVLEESIIEGSASAQDGRPAARSAGHRSASSQPANS
jgi:hypothetical protein